MRLTVDVGVVRTGLWCERCMLPAAVEVELVALSLSGVAPFGTLQVCPGCEER